MSEGKPIIERMAEIYLDGFDDDPLFYLSDIRQYNEPNFIGKNGRFYLCRCYECDNEFGKDNYYPSRASGQCAWCGWKGDPEIIAYIWCKMILAGETDMHETRELLEISKEIRPKLLPALGELTLEEIKNRYPAQYGMAKRGISYEVLDEDDGYPD